MEESYAVLGGLGYVQLDTLLSNLAYRARAPELTLPLPPLALLLSRSTSRWTSVL